MRMASEMKNTSNWDYTHCMTVVSLEMSDEPQKLHVSKRQLYNLVDEFRAMGASIKYSRESKTYYYTNDKKCHFSAKKT